jgi:hypothetical protein
MSRLRLSAAFATALAVSLALPAQALGAVWSPATALSTSGLATAMGIVAVRPATAVALYHGSHGLFLRRSSDGGDTWSARKQLSAARWEDAAIASYGSKIDVAWIEDGTVVYTRSDDGGRTLHRVRHLSPEYEPYPEAVDVARGPQRVVAVIWFDDIYWTDQLAIRTRVSTDGGRTFGEANVLWESTGWQWVEPSIAVGDGVIYAAYVRSGKLLLRRSMDLGAHWNAPQTLAQGDVMDVAMVAAGSTAYVAFTKGPRFDQRVHYRGTNDAGATWTPPSSLSPAGADPSRFPHLSIDAGVIRAVFEQCLDAECSQSDVYYRESTNGLTWTSAESVTEGLGRYEWPAGVTAGPPIVLYTGSLEQRRNVYAQTRLP